MRTIKIYDRNDLIEISFDDIKKYHGYGAYMALGVGFRIVEAAFNELYGEEIPNRKDISILSGHGGPGFRDVFEFVTRAKTRGKYTVDVMTLIMVIIKRFLNDLRRRSVSLIPNARPIPIIGPISGDISIAPITTGMEFTFKPTLAITVANIRIQTLLPLNSMLEVIWLFADWMSMLSAKFTIFLNCCMIELIVLLLICG